MDIPVYLVNGFLESGKTTFIKTTLEDPEFVGKNHILLIVCEEGIEEYDADSLAKKNIDVVMVEEQETFTKAYMESLQKQYRPDQVIIELNGVWKMEDFLDMDTPRDWVTVQIITMVNAETYQNYLNNMRSMIMEHIKYSDTIIFNRCTTETDRLAIRRSIKPVNRKAQVIYETADGIDLGNDFEDVLPFDVNTDPIVIEDDDFGLWYMDALDYPKKYAGKTIRFKGQFYHDKSMPAGAIVPGRFAMQCCANDIAFIVFISKCPSSLKSVVEAHQNRDWIEVEAELNVEFRREYKGKGPVLYIKTMKDAAPAEEEVVYFT
ncbi:MAG: hypothetical protein J6Z03_02485 [Erysipelotrichaceae bacterium]|nr:hypothetical protein [Erysipelotrichaceae bacterium]